VVVAWWAKQECLLAGLEWWGSLLVAQPQKKCGLGGNGKRHICCLCWGHSKRRVRALTLCCVIEWHPVLLFCRCRCTDTPANYVGHGARHASNHPPAASHLTARWSTLPSLRQSDLARTTPTQ